MIGRSLLRRFVPFLLTLFLGILTVYLIGGAGLFSERAETPATDSGSGSATPRADLDVDKPELDRTGTNRFLISSKPRAQYTDAARENNVEGSVILRVTLLASGEVGGIKVKQELPHGLTEQAIKAARKIKFQPATADGVPVSRIVTMNYSFTIY